MTNEQYNRFREIAEGKFKKPIYNAIQKQIQPVIDAYKVGGNLAAMRAANNEILNDALIPVMRELYVSGGLYMAGKQYRELLKIQKKEIGDWRQLIIDFFNKYLLTKAVLPITQTTKDLILNVLTKSIQEGWGETETIAALRMADITRRRTQVIVRTEMGAAFGYGQMVAGQEFNYECNKRWNAVLDKRTRRTHKHGTGVDGEIKRFPERFSNGLLFPGDKAGPAKEVCNCRCRLDIIPIRDANGMLIPKNRPNVTVSPGIGLTTGIQALQLFAQSLLLSESISNLINQE